MAGKPQIPLGQVIQSTDGSHSIWDGKNWAPATNDGTNWKIDRARMAAMGVGGAGVGGALDPNDAKTVAGYHQDFTDADSLASMATQFTNLNRQTDTGLLNYIPGAGIVHPDVSAMDNLSKQMATRLRAPGMRLTQMEFNQFLGAVPTATNTQEQNNAIAKNIFLGHALAAAKSSFYSSYLNSHRTLAGADAGWLAFRGAHFGPLLDHYTSTADLNGQPAAPAGAPAAPAPMAAKPPHAMTDDEIRAALGQ